jgi:PBSX family phage terminase large subunit
MRTNNFTLTNAQLEIFKEIQQGGYNKIALYGGGRSGKTTLILFIILLRAMQFPKSTHLIVRATHNAMKSSIYYQSFGKLLSYTNVKASATFKKNDVDLTIKLDNGSMIQLKGLDHERRQESLLGNEYSTIYFNECSSLNYNLMTSLDSRLAEKICDINQIYFDFNPPTKAHWTYKYFIQKVDPILKISLPNQEKMFVGKVNPVDNPHIANDYVERQKERGAAHYQRFVEGEFQDIGGNIISRDMFSTYYQEATQQHWESIFATIDVAYTDKKQSDYSVFCVWGLNSSRHLYLLDMWRFKERTTVFDNNLYQLYTKWKDGFNNGSSGLRAIYIEKIGNARLIDQLRQKYGSQLIKDNIPRTKDKFSRFLDAQGFIESGKVFLPDSTVQIHNGGKASDFLETFLSECEAFSQNPDDYAHDDIPDCLTDGVYVAQTIKIYAPVYRDVSTI